MAFNVDDKVVGGLATGLVTVLALLGFNATDADVPTIVENVVLGSGVLGTLFAIVRGWFVVQPPEDPPDPAPPEEVE